MGTAVLIGQQRLGEKRSNIQLSTPIDIMPFYSSLFSSLPFPPLRSPVSLPLSPYPYFFTGRISEVGGGEQTHKQVCVCVCVCPCVCMRVCVCYLIVILSLSESGGVFGCFFGCLQLLSLSVCLYHSLFILISIVCLFQHLQMWFLMFRGNCVNSTPMHQVMIRIKCQHVTYAVLRMAWFPLRNQL